MRGRLRGAVLAGAAFTLTGALAQPALAAPAGALPAGHAAIHVMKTMQQVQRDRAEKRTCAVVACTTGPSYPGFVANNLAYGFGNVQHAPHVYLVFWGFNGGNDPYGAEAYLTDFFQSVGGSTWANIDNQYCDGGDPNLANVSQLSVFCPTGNGITNPSNQLWGTVTDSSTPPNGGVGTDKDISDAALRAAAVTGDYSPDAQYVVSTPPGLGDETFGGCAYHSARTATNGSWISYTDLPYVTDQGASCGQGLIDGNLDGFSIVGGHEYAESVTDPRPGGGWTDLVGQETGDKCAWTTDAGTGLDNFIGLPFGPIPALPATPDGQVLGVTRNVTMPNGHIFPVQPLWSNSADQGLGWCSTFMNPDGSQG
ncbi:MAG: hypothetical protein ACYDAY_11670 [Candidatus Dormibacteria bacterium]